LFFFQTHNKTGAYIYICSSVHRCKSTHTHPIPIIISTRVY
jgi:hypothetical protein